MFIITISRKQIRVAVLLIFAVALFLAVLIYLLTGSGSREDRKAISCNANLDNSSFVRFLASSGNIQKNIEIFDIVKGEVVKTSAVTPDIKSLAISYLNNLKNLYVKVNALLLTYGANIISMFISGMLQIFIFACTIKLVFGVVLFTGILSYMVMAAYLLSVISISMLMSSVFRTSAQLQSAAPAFALITGFLGGCFWNFVNIPENMKALAALTPQGWALSAINRLIANPDAALGIQLELMVLLIIPLILLPLSYIIIRTGMRFEKINA
jgi:hypothetical protein